MGTLHFSDIETKYFSDLFSQLDAENKGRVSVSNVQEFLLLSKLPGDALNKIIALSGGVLHGGFSCHDFFVALRLVAASQQDLPLATESLYRTDLPLPQFYMNNNVQCDVTVTKETFDTREADASSPDLIQLSDSDCNTVQEMDKGGYHMMVSEDMDEDGPEDPFSEPSSRITSHSPSVSSNGSDSPTPTNSVHEKNWKQSVQSNWQGMLNDENRELLGTEDDSSDKHSSDGEDDSDPFIITDELRQFYSDLFHSLQPDFTKTIPGPVAKKFFEKSKLPVCELSTIWEMSDVTQDGALSLEEFFTAMHLVVLRRNNIPLPDTLPASLQPTASSNAQHAVESGGEHQSSGGASGSSSGFMEFEDTKNSPHPLSPQNKEWTKFVDSPTNTGSSHQLKPVNFDFQKSAVEQDPKILHPKPLRVTPESKRQEGSEAVGSPEPPVEFPPQNEPQLHSSPKKNCLNSDSKGIHRPLPRKPSVGGAAHPLSGPPTEVTPLGSPEDSSSACGPTSLPLIPPVAHGSVPSNKKEMPPPPPPPPRPQRTHARSSSLDLNKFIGTSTAHIAPPAVPPRASPGTLSPRKGLHENTLNRPLDNEPISPSLLLEGINSQPRKSAFEVYRKPPKDREVNCQAKVIKRNDDEEEKEDEANVLTARPKDKREIQASIRTTKEKNVRLIRLNSELNQDLAEAMEERIALEIQLEQMRLFSS